MRKADYSLLAELIASELKTCREFNATAEIWRLEFLARNFATMASVDTFAFLKACGIE